MSDSTDGCSPIWFDFSPLPGWRTTFDCGSAYYCRLSATTSPCSPLHIQLCREAQSAQAGGAIVLFTDLPAMAVSLCGARWRTALLSEPYSLSQNQHVNNMHAPQAARFG